jgi:hypothetical protein
MFAANGLNYKSVQVPFLLFPLATIPFTYVTSFMFDSVPAAQTTTIFFNFVSVVILGSVVFYLRFMPQAELAGDICNLAFNIFPAYSLGAVIFFNAMYEILIEFRKSTDGTGEDISKSHWNINNSSANVIALITHFVIWTLVLFAIEAGLG